MIMTIIGGVLFLCSIVLMAVHIRLHNRAMLKRMDMLAEKARQAARERHK